MNAISIAAQGAGTGTRAGAGTLVGPWTRPLAATRATECGISLDDQQLVARGLAGEASAWEEILRRHGSRVYNLCHRFTGNASDAEDLTQEVMLRLYRNLGSFRATQGGLGTWILAVARNLLIDHYRRGRNDRRTTSLDAPVGGAAATETARPLAELVPAAGGRPQEAGVWRREVREQVERALTHLSPELREAVILRDLEDLDYKEISAVLGAPEGTVKSRINRGRVELARLLRSRLGAARGAAGGGEPVT